ncbi:hypothetical protein [Parasaccharibacter apium]|uniref:hypothetical protein n=1 Tax=Parasaccharibacter apium TaxID=1510841 RepID=UPI0009DA5D55|nr:hypothetical protein [Parasaccharibacter apium]
MSKRTREDIANLIRYAALIEQTRGTPDPHRLRPGQTDHEGLLEEAAYDLLLAKQGEGPLIMAFDNATSALEAGVWPLNGRKD